jgi:hypothetical protein
VGYQAGYSVTTGGDNLMLGYLAGQSVTATTTGSQDIYIGNYAHGSGVANTQEVVIGYNAAGKGSSTAYLRGDSGVYNSGNTSTWNTTSDQRIKKNIADNNDGLNKINVIQVRNFEYRLPEEVDSTLNPEDAVNKAGVQLGVIAQELQAVLPECVKAESTGVLSVDTSNLTWYLVNAVKQLSAEVESLKAQLKGA